MLEILKAILYGIVEGITEWLPISSTGHLILLDEFLKLNVSESFFEMFEVVIQLGAILAVIVLFFHKLNPFAPSKSDIQKKSTWNLWFKVIVAIIPSGVIGLLFDDFLDEHLYNYIVVALALIVYGVLFILIEKNRENKKTLVNTVDDISYSTAFKIGVFQTLALIPGTSRSGSTILGGMLIGTSRSAAAEFSFFMAIPTMLGASLVKVLKFILDGASMSGIELAILIVGCVVSFVVSMATIKGLMSYVQKHTFSAFGIYRIVLGILVVLYFLITK